MTTLKVQDTLTDIESILYKSNTQTRGIPSINLKTKKGELTVTAQGGSQQSQILVRDIWHVIKYNLTTSFCIDLDAVLSAFNGHAKHLHITSTLPQPNKESHPSHPSQQKQPKYTNRLEPIFLKGVDVFLYTNNTQDANTEGIERFDILPRDFELKLTSSSKGYKNVIGFKTPSGGTISPNLPKLTIHVSPLVLGADLTRLQDTILGTLTNNLKYQAQESHINLNVALEELEPLRQRGVISRVHIQ